MDITGELRNDLLLKEVGHRIAVMRQRARLTQEDSAAKSGISRSALQRLCYTGTRGMGALEYAPTLLDESAEGERVEVEALAALADEVLNARRGARAELGHGSTRFAPILKVGSSAGGARVIIGEVRDAVARWREFADVAEVLPAHARHIADRLSRAS